MKMNFDGFDPNLIDSIKEAVGESVFESWMQSPNPSLHGKTPWEILNSPRGPELIEGLVAAINYGLPSD
jgi:uncharacterized protein (DUF2384 family)